MTIVAIHQPGYLPWLGFFKKMMNSEIFVFLDHVQYERKCTQNRNKIRTSDGSMWLTVPVLSHQDSKINEVKIDETKHWSLKHKKSIILNYSKAPFFDEHKDFLEHLYGTTYDRLLDLNLEIIKYVMKVLEIKTKTFLSSELNVEGKGSEMVLNICKAMKCDLYISGTLWARNHLHVEDFKKNGMMVQFENFNHPVYRQKFEPFIPNMSIIDLLFNEGKNAKDILRNVNNFIISIDDSQGSSENRV